MRHHGDPRGPSHHRWAEVLRIQHKRLGRVEINTAGYGQFINERYGKDEAAEAVVASARSRLAELT